MRRGIKQGLIANNDFSPVRAQQPRDAIEQRGFSRARRAEENADAGRRFERDVENKGRSRVAALLADARGERGCIHLATSVFHVRAHTRRLTAYTIQSTAKEIARSKSAR